MISEDKKQDKMGKSNYRNFFLMLGLSFVAMYITMYMNTYEWDHIYFSLTRFYMACLGISAMAVIMLSLMLKMYKNKKKNIAIYVGSLILFVSALGLVRAQQPIIGDVLWMKAMIPHHSIAILTSKRADISDPEAKKLAEEIIEAQVREIAEMKKIIKRLENKEE
jgi:cell division protein FtsW (lipid II flippase)